MDLIRHRGADEEVDDTPPPKLTPNTKNALDDLADVFSGVEIRGQSPTVVGTTRPDPFITTPPWGGKLTPPRTAAVGAAAAYQTASTLPHMASPTRRSPRRSAVPENQQSATEDNLLTAVLAKAASSPLPDLSPAVKGVATSPSHKQQKPLVVRYKRESVERALSRQGTPELIDDKAAGSSSRDAQSGDSQSESFVSADSRFSAPSATAAVLERASSFASQRSLNSPVSVSNEKPEGTSRRGPELKASLPHATPFRKSRTKRQPAARASDADDETDCSSNSASRNSASRVDQFARFRAERRDGLAAASSKSKSNESVLPRPRAEELLDVGHDVGGVDDLIANHRSVRHASDVDALTDAFAQSTTLAPSPHNTRLSPKPGPGRSVSAPSPNLGKVGLCYSDIMELHAGPTHHFERPQRHAEVVERFQKRGLEGRCEFIEPREASDAELLECHSPEHVRYVATKFDKTSEDRVQGEGDIFWTTHTERSARYAAGCTTDAALRVASGTLQKAFAVVRPPGHHAECARAMGFCFFNNTVVAAKAVLKQYPDKFKKILLLDWDVHHGNGIQDLTYESEHIMYVSLHRKGPGFYPETGELQELGSGAGLGFNVNIPWLEKGLSDADYLAAFELVIEPIAEQFAPDLVIVAAGYDAAEGDPLGGMRVSDQGYALMTERLGKLANGKMVVALEGGYGLTATANAAAATLSAMLGFATLPLGTRRRPRRSTVELLTQIATTHAEYWPCLKTPEHLGKLAEAARAARGNTSGGLDKSPSTFGKDAPRKVTVTAVSAPATPTRTSHAS